MNLPLSILPKFSDPFHLDADPTSFLNLILKNSLFSQILKEGRDDFRENIHYTPCSKIQDFNCNEQFQFHEIKS